jgi:hypothetical protein
VVKAVLAAVEMDKAHLLLLLGLLTLVAVAVVEQLHRLVVQAL